MAQAQCTKDTDCKGDRVCEEGKCTSPPAPAGAAARPVPAEAPAAAEAPAPVPGTPEAPLPAEVVPPEPAPVAATAPLGEDEPAMRRRSKAAMTTGIVLLSIAPIALLGALAAKNAQEQCDDELQNRYPGHVLPTSERYRAERCDGYSAPLYVLGIGGAVLAVAGIPLIIYGAPRVPGPKAAAISVSPWANAQSGGVRLRWAL
ncbi:MAG: hypothetical protein EOO73_23560 [Myxococcales bacterium]|nr:MAG: hypothetical protein EOO73_23560 [Myxococcales bacterium]